MCGVYTVVVGGAESTLGSGGDGCAPPSVAAMLAVVPSQAQRTLAAFLSARLLAAYHEVRSRNRWQSEINLETMHD